MTNKTRKRIETAADKQLRDIVGSNAQYVDKMLKKAAAFFDLELPDVASYLREFRRRESERVKEKWGLSLKQYEVLQTKAEQMLAGFASGYSMGDMKTLLIDGKVFKTRNACRKYAASCTWQPKHGDVKISLTMKQFKSIQLIEGVWTITGKNNTCHWLSCEGHHGKFRVVLKKGFLVGDSHGQSISECEALEKAKAIKRQKEARSLCRFVGLIDRQSAGACEPGVLAFCARHGLDSTMGYRLDYLMGLNDPIARPYLDRLAQCVTRDT